jgi:uncharacterized protein (DUF1015 family)
MPEIQAFRAIRYNLGRVGSLADVIAPPYDVINTELQDELYRKHPNNVVRLILNRQDPATDDEQNNRYTRAKRFLKDWQAEGVLFTESDPAIYVYHQEFTSEGQTFVRKGFMARMRLSRFGEGQVFPHEETLSGPKVDRLMLTAMCKANLSQVFGLYPEAGAEVDSILSRAIADRTPLEAVDHLGVIHRVWPVTDVAAITAVAAAIGPRPVYIADGHHRYETACNYREQVRDALQLKAEHPANFVLMQFVSMEDDGLLVLPTHRLFRGVPSLTYEELAAKLGDCFTVRPAGQGPDAASAVWEDVSTSNDPATLGLFTKKDNRWMIARPTAAGHARMAEVAAEHGPEWQALGVAVLHRLVVETLLGQKNPPKPHYVHLVQEVIEGLKTDEFPLAALVMPASVKDIRDISSRGERMPAKSTYFYPKLLSGLVINPLE